MSSSWIDPRERIGIVTDEISEDLPIVREFLDGHPVGAVELRMVAGRRVPDLAPENRATLLAWARDRDPAVLAVSPGLFKCDAADAATARRHLEDVLPRSLELARELDARFVIAFSFENLAGGPVGHGPAEALAAAAEACAAAGVELLVENEPGFVACTGAETAALVRAAGHGNLFVNWDPANAGDLGTAALAEGLQAVFPHVRHVHVKNGRARPGERFPRYGPLMDGDIDWPTHLRLLGELGYRGHFGVETHYEPRIKGSATVLAELGAMLDDLGPAEEES